MVVEDADEVSSGVSDVVRQCQLAHVLLSQRTDPRMKLNATDKNWKVPRGVQQRNAALKWLRTNFDGSKSGVVYFGDDDNTYDLRLFPEIRSVRTVGMWPVGTVGGLIVDTPIVSPEIGKVVAFSAIWKPDRPFPIDMAGFAVPRGYQESHLLSGLGIGLGDIEPKANNCTRVYVWHTRTEVAKLKLDQPQKFASRTGLSHLEQEAVGGL